MRIVILDKALYGLNHVVAYLLGIDMDAKPVCTTCETYRVLAEVADFTSEEREAIAKMLAEGRSVREIKRRMAKGSAVH